MKLFNRKVAVSYFLLILLVAASIIVTAVAVNYWLFINSGEGLFKYEQTITDVTMSQAIVDHLNSHWSDYPDIEQIYCLDGYRDRGTIHITGYYKPKTLKATEDELIFISCTRITNVGTIHQHPSGRCELSREDVYVFGKSNDMVMMTICDIDNIRYFTPTELNLGSDPTIV